MADVFACPECGEGVEVAGFAAGRQVRCASCGTLVEVPYLRRHRSKRGRFSRSARRFWLAGTILAGVVALLFLTVRLIGSKVRDDSRREFEGLVAQAKQEEARGDLGSALRNTIAALKFAESRKTIQDLDALRLYRDQLSHREVAERLDGLAGMDPESALGEVLILADRVKTDEALSAMRDTILAAVTQQRIRAGSRQLDAASSAFEAYHFTEALDRAVRILDLPDIQTDTGAATICDRAREMIARVARSAGVRVEPVRGTFQLGSADSYQRATVAQVEEFLRGKGYVIPKNPESLGSFWNGRTGYRLIIAIQETQDGHYLQSANRLTRIDARVELLHGDTPFWYTAATGRTHVPPRNMSALEAGHVASAKTRSAKAEQRLFDDAISALMERLAGKLGTVPVPAT